MKRIRAGFSSRPFLMICFFKGLELLSNAFNNQAIMHASDLGVLLYLEGCILFDLFKYHMKGAISTPTAELRDLTSMIRQAGKALHLDTPAINGKLSMTMIKGKGAPKLKVKASQARKLLSCLVYILQNFIPLETNYQQTRLHCVMHFESMYRNLKEWGGLHSGLTAAVHARKGLLLMAELQHMNLEWARHHRNGFFLYKFYPKMHQLLHIVETQIPAHGNPMLCWCYPDESEIGASIKVAEALHVSKLHRSVIRKHRLL